MRGMVPNGICTQVTSDGVRIAQCEQLREVGP